MQERLLSAGENPAIVLSCSHQVQPNNQDLTDPFIIQQLKYRKNSDLIQSLYITDYLRIEQFDALQIISYTFHHTISLIMLAGTNESYKIFRGYLVVFTCI